MSPHFFATAQRFIAIFTVSLVLLGCVSTPPTSGLPEAPKVVASRPTFEAPNLEPYLLEVGDVVDIKLMSNPELNDQAMVRPDGMISTTVVQEVPAYGRRIMDVQADLVRAYSRELSHPKLTVILRSFAPNRIYVTGEVDAPGEFITVGPNLTLTQAIARAGGLRNSARPDNIIILRRGSSDQPQAYVANYKAAVTGTDASSDIRLAPYDVVFVPRSDVGDAYLYFQQYLQQFVPASFGLSYQIGSNGTVVAP